MRVFFDLIVIAPLVVWASMLLFPQRRFTLSMVMAPWPVVALAAAWLVASVAQVSTGSLLSLELDSVRSSLGSAWGAIATTAAWQGLTLVAGTWIFRDARYYGIRTAPYLIGTLLLGPVGPAAYLLARRRRERTGGGNAGRTRPRSVN